MIIISILYDYDNTPWCHVLFYMQHNSVVLPSVIFIFSLDIVLYPPQYQFQPSSNLTCSYHENLYVFVFVCVPWQCDRFNTCCNKSSLLTEHTHTHYRCQHDKARCMCLFDVLRYVQMGQCCKLSSKWWRDEKRWAMEKIWEKNTRMKLCNHQSGIC